MKNELVFDAPRGHRLHRYFIGVTIDFESSLNLWWYPKMREWAPSAEYPNEAMSTHAKCRTLKAYKRMLRKHPVLVGRSRLCNRYVGYDVISCKQEVDHE